MSEIEQPQGLSDLCRRHAITLHPFDMGRQLRPWDADAFAALEAGTIAYPWPFQRKARLALVGSGEADEPFVWFLDLPLDEAGHLHPAVRDDLLARLAAAHAQADQPDPLTDPLKDSAYGFTPDQERMAALHARAAADLGRPASAYYDHARLYLDGEHGWEQWAFLGLQGLADVAARIDRDDNARRVAEALPHLPEVPFNTLCQQLEHATPPDELAEALLSHLEESTAPERAAVLLRALSGAATPAVREGRRAWLRRRLEGAEPEQEMPLLAALAARGWDDLAEPAIAAAFLEALIRGPAGEEGFNQTLRELLGLVELRPQLRPVLLAEERSAAVREAVHAFGLGG